MQVRKRHEKQGIKPVMKQTSAETRMVDLEAQHGIYSQSKKGDVKQEEETYENQCGGEPEGILQ